MRRKIHTQGDFDGACFLYAIANAFTALTGIVPELTQWDQGIALLPYPVDFLQGCGGTTLHYDQDRTLLASAISSMLTQFTEQREPLSSQWVDGVRDLHALSTLITETSVALFWYQGNTAHVQNGSHWVCGVAREQVPLTIHLACSIRHADDGRFNDKSYVEHYHEHDNRYSNDWITEAMDLQIMPKAVFQISTASYERA